MRIAIVAIGRLPRSPEAELVKLYVERGTLDRWSYEERVLYTGTEAPEATALLEHLLSTKRPAPTPAKKSPRGES